MPQNTDSAKKTMHINLYDGLVRDYETVKSFYGISNDNDLVRFLFSLEAKRIDGLLAMPPAPQTAIRPQLVP